MSDIMLPCELLAPLESLQKQHECDPSCVTTKQELGSLYLRLVDTAWLQVATTPVPDAVRDILNLIHMALDLGVQLSVYERIELHFRTAAAFHYLGRHTDCMAQIEQAIALQKSLIDQHPLAESNIRFLQTRTGVLSQFGHLCSEIDVFLKMRAMGWIPNYRPILSAPHGNVANRCMLDYWREHVCVVTNPDLCTRLAPLKRDLEYNSYWVDLPNSERRYGHSNFCVVQNAWEQQGGQPYIELSAEQRQLGEQKKHELGIPEGAWFVSFHARTYSISAINKGKDSHPTRCRDVELESYFPVLEEIVRRGGYVVRTGDPSLPKLPDIPGVIDYAHSD